MFPIAIELGIDPIHLGIIMVVNMEIGMITPPVGLNLFRDVRRCRYADDECGAGRAAIFRRYVYIPNHGDLHPCDFNVVTDIVNGAGNNNEVDDYATSCVKRMVTASREQCLSVRLTSSLSTRLIASATLSE